MGTALSCIEGSQVAGLIRMKSRNSSSCSCPSKMDMINRNRHMLSMHIHVRQYKVLVEAYKNGPEVVYTYMYVL